jgi:hypothetical protein
MRLASLALLFFAVALLFAAPAPALAQEAGSEPVRSASHDALRARLSAMDPAEASRAMDHFRKWMHDTDPRVRAAASHGFDKLREEYTSAPEPKEIQRLARNARHWGLLDSAERERLRELRQVVLSTLGEREDAGKIRERMRQNPQLAEKICRDAAQVVMRDKVEGFFRDNPLSPEERERFKALSAGELLRAMAQRYREHARNQVAAVMKTSTVSDEVRQRFDALPSEVRAKADVVIADRIERFSKSDKLEKYVDSLSPTDRGIFARSSEEDRRKLLIREAVDQAMRKLVRDQQTERKPPAGPGPGKPGDKPEHKPEHKPGDKPEHKPGHKPESETYKRIREMDEEDARREREEIDRQEREERERWEEEIRRRYENDKERWEKEREQREEDKRNGKKPDKKPEKKPGDKPDSKPDKPRGR